MSSARARLKFCEPKLFLCRHLVKRSERLLKVLSLFDFNMANFFRKANITTFSPGCI